MVVEGTQISILIIGVVVIILILWSKSNSHSIDKYNLNHKKQLKRAFEKEIPELKKKGFSDLAIHKMYEKLEYDFEHQESEIEENLNDLVRDPIQGIKNISEKESKDMEALGKYYDNK